MKRFLVALIALAVLASCALPFGGTGSLRISFEGVQARAAVVAGDPVRIQLLRNGTVVPLSGKAYLEEKAAGQTVVIDGLNAGSGYQVLVASGKYQDGLFVGTQFGRSKTFEIVAGVDTAQTVAPDHLNLTYLAQSAGQAGAVAVVNEQLYYLASDGIRRLGLETPWSVAALGSGAINSFGRGYEYRSGAFFPMGSERLQINTTAGLSYLTALGVTSPGIPQESGTVHPNVTSSSSVRLEGEDGAFFFYLYAGGGLTAGGMVMDEGTTEDEEWADLESGLEDLDESLRDTLRKAGSVVGGFDSTDEYAYISTAVGTFRLTSQMISKGVDRFDEYFSVDHPDWKPLDDNHRSLEMLIDASEPVGPVSTASLGTSGLVFLGTKKGLYAGPVDADGLITEGPTEKYIPKWETENEEGETISEIGEETLAHKATIVASTANRNIVRLASVSFQGAIYTAAYAADTAELYLLKGRDLVRTLPSFGGLPAGVPELAWFPTTEEEREVLKLAIGGDDGSVILTVVN